MEKNWDRSRNDTDKQAERKTERQMDRKANGHEGRWTERQMDRKADGQEGRWTEMETDIMKKDRQDIKRGDRKEKQTKWQADTQIQTDWRKLKQAS